MKTETRRRLLAGELMRQLNLSCLVGRPPSDIVPFSRSGKLCKPFGVGFPFPLIFDRTQTYGVVAKTPFSATTCSRTSAFALQ